MILQTFQLQNRSGNPIRGDLRMPGPSPSRTAIVVVHGFKGFKDWGFFPYLCEKLCLDGHDVVSFDFSLNGVEDGEVRDLDAFSRNTFTRELDELRHVLEVVSSGDLSGRRPEKLGLLGHSRGGGTAILSVVEAPEVDALVTWGAVDHLDRWTPETLAEWKREGVVHILNQRTGQQLPLSLTLFHDFQTNRERLDIQKAAGALEAPWLILHGRDDSTVSVEEGQRLSQVSRHASVIILEAAGHTFEAVHPFQGTTPALDAALNATCAHFDRYLREG